MGRDRRRSRRHHRPGVEQAEPRRLGRRARRNIERDVITIFLELGPDFQSWPLVALEVASAWLEVLEADEFLIEVPGAGIFDLVPGVSRALPHARVRQLLSAPVLGGVQ